MKLIPAITVAATLAMSNTAAAQMAAAAPGPHLLVYKTKKDYRQLVPVMLSDDKKSIVSYPDPQDIRVVGSAITPTSLKDGYLMDNRGIGENVAFLNITYKQYAKLKTAPEIEKLYSLIKDKDPLVMLCDCGLKQSFKDPKADVNKLIAGKRLTTKCKVLKQAGK